MVKGTGANEWFAHGEIVNTRLAEIGLDKAAAILSEGRCPLCLGRSVDFSVIDREPDEERPAAFVVNCVPCMLQWRSAINPHNGKDWIEHTGQVADGVIASMTINAPHEPEEHWDD